MNTCRHGYAWHCSECHEEHQADTRRAVREGRKVYAVVPWRGDGRYSADQAVKTYRSLSLAEKYATKTNDATGSQLVVRVVDVPA